MNPPTKPSLQTCAELLRAANTEREMNLAIRAAARHGYTVQELQEALASLPPKK